MQSLNLAELERVDDEADVTITREPHAVMVICKLVSVANPVGDYWAVAANIKNGGCRLCQALGDIQVGGHVKTGTRLKMEVLNRERLLFKTAGDDSLQVRARWQRREAQHLRQLRAQYGRLPAPFVAGGEMIQRTLTQSPRLAPEEFGQRLVVHLPLSQQGGRWRDDREKYCPKDEKPFHGCESLLSGDKARNGVSSTDRCLVCGEAS